MIAKEIELCKKGIPQALDENGKELIAVEQELADEEEKLACMSTTDAISATPGVPQDGEAAGSIGDVA